MATYDFRCTCGVVIEHIQPITDELPRWKKCPKCGRHAVQVITAPYVATSGMSQAPIDVVIGKDAERRWDRIHERQQAREKARKESGTSSITEVKLGEFRGNDKKREFVSTPDPIDD